MGKHYDATFHIRMNALSWRVNPITTDEIEVRLAAHGFDHHAVTAEVFAQAREIYLTFDNLLIAAQNRRMMILRELHAFRRKPRNINAAPELSSQPNHSRPLSDETNAIKGNQVLDASCDMDATAILEGRPNHLEMSIARSRAHSLAPRPIAKPSRKNAEPEGKHEMAKKANAPQPRPDDFMVVSVKLEFRAKLKSSDAPPLDTVSTELALLTEAASVYLEQVIGAIRERRLYGFMQQDAAEAHVGTGQWVKMSTEDPFARARVQETNEER